MRKRPDILRGLQPRAEICLKQKTGAARNCRIPFRWMRLTMAQWQRHAASASMTNERLAWSTNIRNRALRTALARRPGAVARVNDTSSGRRARHGDGDVTMLMQLYYAKQSVACRVCVRICGCTQRRQMMQVSKSQQSVDRYSDWTSKVGITPGLHPDAPTPPLSTPRASAYCGDNIVTRPNFFFLV